MTDERTDLYVAEGVNVVDGPRGVRLRGAADRVAATVEGLRALAMKPEGYRVNLGDWKLCVSEFVPEHRQAREVTMPAHAWNIAASILRDVAYGEYANPFDFQDCGYLVPPADPDVGVEIVGPVLDQRVLWRRGE